MPWDALAIDTYRTLLPEAPEPDRSGFARHLNAHAWNLCLLGEPGQAPPFAEEAVSFRPSDAQSASRRMCRAECLDTLATALALLGRTDDALAPCHESLDIRRKLAEDDHEKYGTRVAPSESLLARLEGRVAGSFTER